MKDFHFIYNLLNQKGIGRVKVNKILQSFENILTNGLLEKDIISNKLNNFFSNEQLDEIINTENNVEMKFDSPEVFFMNRFNNHFPESLKDLQSNCPPILSCIGNVELLNSKMVGFCGSRKASKKGIEVAKDIAQQIASKDIVIVSGYASGIDQETHYWALKEGGSTILVLPEGIQNFSIKKRIKEVWDWEKVLVVSEFNPNAIWSVNRAMQRNTTIIGLSNIMVLIEAKTKGGSIDAGYKTLQMNKPLFAPVYSGIPEEASGNQLLLTKGALPLMKKRETGQANLDKMLGLINSKIDAKNTLF